MVPTRRTGTGLRRVRRLVLALVALVVVLAGIVGAALWLAFKPMFSLSSPSLQTSGFHVDQVGLEYERFLESLWAFSAGQGDAAQVSLRLDILASRIAPARELTGVKALPGPARTLALLERRIAEWTPKVEALGRTAASGDPAQQARLLPMAQALIEEIKPLRPALLDMVVETNQAFVDTRDGERLAFRGRFKQLVLAVSALAAGVVALVGVLWRALLHSRRLGRLLSELNLTLEDRVAQRTRQLQERERQLHTILDASPVAVALLAADDERPLFVNQRFRQQFAALASDGAPAFASIFASAADVQDFWRVFHIARGVEDYEVRLRQAQAPAHGWSLVSARELVMDGRPVVLFWAYDISTRKTLEAELRQLAHTDPLTGVMNRRAFVERCDQEIAKAQRYQRPVALLMLDIDHFKQVNDTHGHGAGDTAIQHVAEVGLRSLRALDQLGRLGGEEFGILLHEAPLSDALAAAERLRAAIEAQPAPVQPRPVALTISVGVATLGAGEDFHALYQRVDEALYAAKRGGRNRVHVAPLPVPVSSLPGDELSRHP